MEQEISVEHLIVSESKQVQKTSLIGDSMLKGHRHQMGVPMAKSETIWARKLMK